MNKIKKSYLQSIASKNDSAMGTNDGETLEMLTRALRYRNLEEGDFTVNQIK